MSKRTKLHHEDDWSSDASSSLLWPPTPSSTPAPSSSSPPPPPLKSSETTQKVYLSWCKKSGKEYERVPELVERLRRLLWLRRIRVFDRDLHVNFPGDEVTSSVVLIFGTMNYFADLDCLEELKLIWDSKPRVIIPLFYDKGGELKHFVHKYSLRPLYDRPLLKPLDEHWDPPPLQFMVQGTNGKIYVIDVNVQLDEHGNRPKELVDAAVEVELAKAQAEDDNKEKEGEADAENEKAEGEGEADAEGEAEGEEEDNTESDSDTDDDDNDQVVYENSKEEPLTLGSFFHKTADKISWMRIPSDASLQTEYDEINIYALKVWPASNPAALDYNYKVGLESHLNALLPFFNPIREADKEFMCILIEGPAGSGKSTIAKFMYNNISTRRKHFRNFKYIRHPDIYSQDELIAYIFKDVARSRIRRTFYKAPFLVFFDNINSAKDAQHIAPVLELVPKRSTVVIATRYPDLVLCELPSNAKHHPYTIEKLDDILSLELFSLRAFEQNHPPKDYIKLAQSAVYRADGSPSKLVYLASRVCRIDEDDVMVTLEDFESLWDKLESEQNKAITIGACHDKSDRNEEAKLMFPTTKVLASKIVSGSYSLKILADLIDRMEETYLEDQIIHPHL